MANSPIALRPPPVVLLGDAGPEFSYAALNQCFRLLLDGLPLLSMGQPLLPRGRAITRTLGLVFMAVLEYAAELEPGP